MKSLILWNAYKSNSDRAWPSFIPGKYLQFLWVIALTFLLLSGCSEKIPTLPLDKNLISFDSVSVSADLIADTTIISEPYIGSNSYLVVGEDDNISAYSLLLFEDLASPLDTIKIDSILSCELVLRTATYLPSATASSPNLTMTISSLDADGADAWTEDSTNITNFSLDNFTPTEWYTFTYSDTDTLILDLTASYIDNWRDTATSHYGIVIKAAPGSEGGLGIIYSGETSYYPYLKISYKDSDGDTLTAAYTTEEDVTILNFKKDLTATPQQLLITSGLASYIFLKFRVEGLITDKNLLIAGANLYLTANPDLTEDYEKYYTVYVSLLDSTDWDDLAYSPSTSDYVATVSCSPGDSVFVLKIPNTIQLFTSGYNGNFGVALWTASSSIYPGLLSFYPTESADPLLRPHMEILTMQEE